MQDRMNTAVRRRFYLRDEDVTQRGTWMPAVDIYETEATTSS